MYSGGGGGQTKNKEKKEKEIDKHGTTAEINSRNNTLLPSPHSFSVSLLHISLPLSSSQHGLLPVDLCLCVARSQLLAGRRQQRGEYTRARDIVACAPISASHLEGDARLSNTLHRGTVCGVMYANGENCPGSRKDAQIQSQRVNTG